MNFLKIKELVFGILVLVLLSSCSATHQIKKEFRKNDQESSFFKGFVVYNPATKKELINHNGAKYFTPASNTKLFTFYTAYKTLKDSIKSLAYYKKNDSLVIKGTADPSLFYFGSDSIKVVEFLKNQSDSIYLINATIDETAYGSGWSWDDYQDYYMPEKSLFPMYGNILKYAIKKDSIVSKPNYFKKRITVLDSISITRRISKNEFYINRTSVDTFEVPFKTSNVLTAALLSNAIGKKIKLIPNQNHFDFKFLYGISYDSLYRQLLVQSDNFIAEQLMLQVGKEVADSYNVNAAIEYSLRNYLQDLPQKPRWVDGSGLSRYNLFSPNDMVFLLNKMYHEIPLEKLLGYFPVGGESGTLKNWYDNEKPYVYAKSGTLSNNYSLSGYLITKKNTFVIFSYMNNHYKLPTSEVKKEIQRTLEKIYNSY